MDMTGDLRQSVRDSVSSLEPSHLWALGLVVEDDGSIVGPAGRQSTYRAECECPGDCLRDHENE